MLQDVMLRVDVFQDLVIYLRAIMVGLCLRICLGDILAFVPVRGNIGYPHFLLVDSLEIEQVELESLLL